MKYIIFIDVDGTIYSKDKKIHPQTYKDIAFAQKNGVEVVINTGNGPFSNMRNLAKELNIRYVVNSNGASIYDFHENKLIYKKTISKDLVNKMLAFADSQKLSSDWWNEHDIYINKYTPQSTIEIIQHAMCNDAVPAFSDAASEDMFKIEFYGSKEDVHKIDAIINEFKNDGLNFARMLPHHVEVTPPGVSKGDGVKHFAELFNVDLKNTCSIGDSANDHSMFAVTGHSYAMDNADEVTKTKTTHYTSDVKQNGVGEAIIDFMFRMGIDK